MKSQVDRYTVAYESERFPYFTINVLPPPLDCGNRGGTMAFFERCSFVKRHADRFEEWGVYVNADCGFHVSREEDWTALCVLISCYAGPGPAVSEEEYDETL